VVKRPSTDLFGCIFDISGCIFDLYGCICIIFDLFCFIYYFLYLFIVCIGVSLNPWLQFARGRCFVQGRRAGRWQRRGRRWWWRQGVVECLASFSLVASPGKKQFSRQTQTTGPVDMVKDEGEDVLWMNDENGQGFSYFFLFYIFIILFLLVI
jgi:hypothetical protein